MYKVLKHTCLAFELFAINATPARRATPPLKRLHSKLSPRLTRLPHLADRATRLGELPHLSCKRDQDKMRDYMERRVTPPWRVTSPTWDPPPPCKQALRLKNKFGDPIPTCITRLQSAYQNITFLQI